MANLPRDTFQGSGNIQCDGDQILVLERQPICSWKSNSQDSIDRRRLDRLASDIVNARRVYTSLRRGEQAGSSKI